MSLLTIGVLLGAATSRASADYPLAEELRPLTQAGGVLTFGFHLGLQLPLPYAPLDSFRRLFPLDGGVLIRYGITHAVQLTLPLVIHVGFGDRTGIDALEFAAFGGIRRLELGALVGSSAVSFFPTLGFSMRSHGDVGTIRTDLEVRGTSPLRLGSGSGEARLGLSWIQSLGERISLGLSLSGVGFLRGNLDRRLTTPDWAVSLGSTEETPLFRFHVFDSMDFDVNFRVTPLARIPQVMGGFGLRFILGARRTDSAGKPVE